VCVVFESLLYIWTGNFFGSETALSRPFSNLICLPCLCPALALFFFLVMIDFYFLCFFFFLFPFFSFFFLSFIINGVFFFFADLSSSFFNVWFCAYTTHHLPSLLVRSCVVVLPQFAPLSLDSHAFPISLLVFSFCVLVRSSLSLHFVSSWSMFSLYLLRDLQL